MNGHWGVGGGWGAGDCPGPRKGATTRRNVTQGVPECLIFFRPFCRLRLLTSFSITLVICMCCMLCGRRLKQHHTCDSSHVTIRGAGQLCHEDYERACRPHALFNLKQYHASDAKNIPSSGKHHFGGGGGKKTPKRTPSRSTCGMHAFVTNHENKYPVCLSTHTTHTCE